MLLSIAAPQPLLHHTAAPPSCRYDAQFVGMLETDADGVGVWSTSDTTVVAQVNNAIFGPFAGQQCHLWFLCRSTMHLWPLCRLTMPPLVPLQVNNATFGPFAELCDGKYGAKPTLPEHTVLAVNPAWSDSRDIGHPWDR
jgi:hypothetical protein